MLHMCSVSSFNVLTAAFYICLQIFEVCLCAQSVCPCVCLCIRRRGAGRGAARRGGRPYTYTISNIVACCYIFILDLYVCTISVHVCSSSVHVYVINKNVIVESGIYIN